MKTNRYILSLLLLMVSVFNLTPANAQQNQYAIYNYRNDGDFNAWLNIDVEKITYSCTDTLGVEHDEVVVQEVWTPDSVYRIPINAIDSIGFRAPETKYKEGVFFLNEKHEPYVRIIDDLNITFDKSTPDHLLPSVGQIIVTETSYGILEDGFAGRAVSIRNTDDGMEFVCEEVSLSDIFEQFIYVSKCSTSEGVDPQKNLAKSSRKRIFDYGIGIDEVISIKLNPVESPKEIDGEKMPVQFKYTPEMEITCLISVLKDHPAVAKVTFRHSHSLNLGMDYEGNLIKPKSKEWWFSKKDIRIHIPVAAVDAVIKPYVNFGAFVDYNAKVKFEYELPLLKFEQTFGVDYSEYRKEEDRLRFINETEFIHEDPTISLSLDGTLAFGLAMKIGAKLISKRLLNFEAIFHVGPEFKGHIDLSTDRIGEDANLYRQLKNTTLDLYGYVSIPKATYQYVGSGVKLAKRGTWKGAKWSNRVTKTEDLLPNEDNPEGVMTDWPIRKWYILPEFNQPKVYEAAANSAVASIQPSRNLLLPVKVGVAFENYQTGEIAEKEYGSYWGEKHNAESNYTQTFDNLPSSTTYKVYPTVSILGLKMQAEPSVDYSVAGELIVNPKDITIKKGEKGEVSILGGSGNFTTIDNDPNIARSLDIIYDHRTGHHITLPILGVNSGTTYITVQDRRNGSSYNVNVTVVDDVTPDLALSETTVSLKPNETTEVAITSGSGSYTVANSNEEVAVAAISNGDKVAIAARKAGTATITVTDTKTKQTATIAVTVTEEASDDLTLSETSVSLQKGDRATVTITSGSGQYTLTNSNSQIVTAAIANTNQIVIAGQKAGTATITVTDTKTKQTATIAVTVTEEDEGPIDGEVTKEQYEAAKSAIEQNGRYKIFTRYNGKSLGTTKYYLMADGHLTADESKARTFVFGQVTGSSLFVTPGWKLDVPFTNPSLSNGATGDLLPHGYIRTDSQNRNDWEGQVWYKNGDRYAVRSTNATGNTWGANTYWTALDSNTDGLPEADYSLTPKFIWYLEQSLTLSSTSVFLGEGDTKTVEITPNSGSYTAISSAPNVATAEVNNATVVITALKAGTATITVTDTKTQQTATIAVTVTDGTDVSPGEAIDLGLPSGTLWASCNVGATKPEEYGDYFAWGETKGYNSGKTTFNMDTYFDSSYKKYDINGGLTELALEDDAAYVNWGSSWRMPSKEQQDELRSQCTWTWTQLNGVNGYRVTSKTNGNSIFLPAAGWRDGTSLYSAGSHGYYWSRSLYTNYSYYAYYLYFYSGYVDWYNGNRCSGKSVRPVRR